MKGFNEGTAQEIRDRLIKMATDASDDETRLLASYMHLGHQVCEMIDSLTMAQVEMETSGMDTDAFRPMAVHQITRKEGGQTYQIHVHEVGDEERDHYAKAMNSAKELGEGFTRH